MIFSNSITTLPEPTILNTHALTKVYTEFLCIIIDDRLTWKSHVTHSCKKVSRITGVINKIKHFFPQPSLHILYCTLVLSTLNYGILAWGHFTKQNPNKFIYYKKGLMRIICNKSYRSHTNTLFL